MKATDALEGLTQLQEAQRIVLESTPILGVEKISILDALGRIERLAEDLVNEVVRRAKPAGRSVGDHDAARHLS